MHDHNDETSTPKNERIEARGGLFDTSEIELLLSGAFVFSLFKAPDLLRTTADYVARHYPDSMTFRMIFVCLNLAAMILLVSFLAHLVVRGFWISSMGLYSVFPAKTKVKDTQSGPLMTRFMRAKLMPLPTLIKRADQVASLIFSFSMVFVVVYIYAAITLTVLGLAYLTYGAQFGFFNDKYLMAAFALVAFGPMFALSLIDLWYKKTGRTPSKRMRKLWSKAWNVTYTVWLSWLTSPIIARLKVSVSSKVFILSLYSSLALAMFSFVLFTFAATGVFDDFAYPNIPKKGPMVLRDDYYEDRVEYYPVLNHDPLIPSEIVTGPYLKLFLPLSPKVLDKMRDQCEELPTFAVRGSEYEGPPEQEVLDCLGGAYSVLLDDVELGPQDMDRLFYVHPITQLRGLQVYLPMDQLSPGKHLLKVVERYEPDEEDNTTHYIPFWR